MKPTIVIPAIGRQYELEAERLLSTFPDAILVTEQHPLYQRPHPVPLLAGLLTKAEFARYLPDDVPGPILLCDADLHALRADPLSEFSVATTTDVALVPYTGRWFYHEGALQQAAERFGNRQLNSGFIYFKSLAVAGQVSAAWHEQFLQRVNDESRSMKARLSEYDEPALMLALVGLDLEVELLDPVWNDWEHTVPGAIFRQTHTPSVPADTLFTVAGGA